MSTTVADLADYERTAAGRFASLIRLRVSKLMCVHQANPGAGGDPGITPLRFIRTGRTPDGGSLRQSQRVFRLKRFPPAL